ncbi:hypothetical protein L1987_52137 [Smallanthus sonchifolius]|uniref:Uncharacterized protein n=1 Tax=Smallanthus sonchifolius TaxID=185202 RepID=A0ACB9ESL8_9ASTR|nr:hypothetical protein L1987_52137 [Smallanthus sonchifolius]
MWRVIHLDRFSDLRGKAVFREICKHAVDRSHGQLVDLTMVGFCNYELLQYVADRSSQLRRLEIVPYFQEVYETLSEPLKKLSLLEELSLVITNISQQDVEAAGRFCPLLKTLKVNQKAIRSWDDDDDYDESMIIENGIALAIGKNLPGLTHLEIIGNNFNNIGLQAILDGCCHLESLDMRRCLSVDPKGDLGKRCSKQIKYLKLPLDSLEGCPHAYYVLDDFDFDFDSDDDYVR